jgi:hypothetical protein
MRGFEPGLVRSFTLATRERSGFGRIVHQYGDPYEGWPADFYMGQVRLVGTNVSAGRFRALVTPLAGEKTINCTAT